MSTTSPAVSRPEPLNKMRLPFWRTVKGVFSTCWVFSLSTSIQVNSDGFDGSTKAAFLAHCGSIATVQLTAFATSISNRMVFLSGPVPVLRNSGISDAVMLFARISDKIGFGLLTDS